MTRTIERIKEEEGSKGKDLSVCAIFKAATYVSTGSTTGFHIWIAYSPLSHIALSI